MKYIVSFLLIAVLTLSAADRATGIDFMKLEHSPSYAATAGAISVFAGNGANVNYNPADLSNIEQTNLKFSYVSLVEDGKLLSFDLAKKNKTGVFGLQLSNFNMDGLKGYGDTPSDEPQWEFDSQSLILAAGYSYAVTERFSAGLSAKFINEKIDIDDAQGFAFSAGVNFKDVLLENLKFSVALTDLGHMGKMNKVSSDLPTSILAGVAYTKVLGSFDLSVALSNKSILKDEDHFLNGGVEVSYLKRFFVRGGYRMENEGRPFSVGLGLVVSSFTFDYALTPFSDDIGTNHGVSIGYTFN